MVWLCVYFFELALQIQLIVGSLLEAGKGVYKWVWCSLSMRAQVGESPLYDHTDALVKEYLKALSLMTEGLFLRGLSYLL